MLTMRARDAYRAGDARWPISLIHALESQQSGKALDWAIEGVRALLKHNPAERISPAPRWLDALGQAKRRGDVSGLRDKSLEIWHVRRDPLHSAISLLYAALVYLLEEDHPGYRQIVGSALRALSHQPTLGPAFVGILLPLFERFHQQGMPPGDYADAGNETLS